MIRHVATIGLLSLSVVAFLACSSDPCSGGGSYSYAETCTKLTTAIQGKCAGATVDCAGLLKPCTSNDKVCKSSIDVGVANINAAADCDAAKLVTLNTTCFQ